MSRNTQKDYEKQLFSLFLTTEQASQTSGYRKRYLHTLLQKKVLPSVKIGRAHLIPKELIDKLRDNEKKRNYREVKKCLSK